MKKFFGVISVIMVMAAFLGGCGSKKDQAKNVDLKEVIGAIKEELGEDYGPNREIEMEEIEALTNIKKEDVEEFIGEGPMMSVSIDTIMAFKAKEGKGESLAEDLDQYRELLINDSFQYPMNIAKVNASKIVKHGDYVFFLMLGKYDDREEASDEERLEFAKEEVGKVENIINKFFE